MKYTNKLNLPQSIVDTFIESDAPVKNRYSVTELLKSNKEILLFGGTPDAELEAALGVEDDIHQLIE